MELYVVVCNGCEWEDLIVFTSKEIAINYSISHKNIRIEVFTMDESQGYTPTYTYYKNGEFDDSMKTHIKNECTS